MLLLLTAIPFALSSTDVLFVGNSYTQNNDLPGAVRRVFEAADQEANTQKVSSGGLTLADHAARAADPSSDWFRTLVTEADARQWVVLQDQSQVPGFPETEAMWIASRDGAVALDSLVRTADAETVFFLTWGRRSGDPMNEWLYPDFSTMQARLTDGYIAFSDATATAERPTWIAPVGPAFQAIHDDVVDLGLEPSEPGNAFYRLYSGDGSHPSATGTQLAAYVFYASLTGRTPIGLSAPDGIEAADALMLQEAADRVVFDRTDAFSFPWESTAEDSNTDPTDDTAAPATDSPDPVDSGQPASDTAIPDDSDEQDPEADPDSDDGTQGMVDDAAQPNGGTKSGCTTVGAPAGLAVILTSILGLFRRRIRTR